MEVESNSDKILRQVQESTQRLKVKLEAALNTWLDETLERIKKKAPVDSGFLRERLETVGARIAGDVIQGSVLSAAEYSSFVEAREPFIEPVLNEQLDRLIERLSKTIESLF